ncbi:flagellin [Arcobacter sp. FWKO B]|uniref:flagellin n=1 Tax=Arcobacter sp. FWKO B TaxID=2593672 RepID=UPI0018A437F7|nr:flagellin [Arcobacter sp. FWKO B]QOG11532.1 flagellin [Arcobacter sp. FWKO B]
MQIGNNVNQYLNPYTEQNKSLQKIATALKINQASDNPSSMMISDALRTQASGYTQALQNANSAVASIQIADKAVSEQSNILDNVREKLIQASTATTSQEGREAILKDIQGLMQNFDDIASSTNYNGQNLLQSSSTDNSATSLETFQLGNTSQDVVTTSEVQSNSLGVGLSGLLTQDGGSFSADVARGFLSQVDNAMDTLNNYRGEFGSTQNQLESSGRNLIQQQVQTQIAQSQLSGADIAQEVSNFNKLNVLSHAGAYAQSQFNVTQHTVLRLLT